MAGNRADAAGLAKAEASGIATLVIESKPFGKDRAGFEVALQRALEETCIDGVKTNIDFVRRVLASPEFGSGDVHTSLGAVVQEREKLAAKHSLPDATTRITNA